MLKITTIASSNNSKRMPLVNGSRCWRAIAARRRRSPLAALPSISFATDASASTSTSRAATSTSQVATLGAATWKTSLLAASCLAVGFGLGQAYQHHHEKHSHDHDHDHVLPNGLPRTCCESDNDQPKLTPEQEQLPRQLKRIAGKQNVLDGTRDDQQTLPFLRGARLGKGKALAIVTPEKLQDAVDAIQAIVDADCAVVPQGQNTGLTGGSVPKNDESSFTTTDGRPVVVVSFQKLNRLFPLDHGQRVVCLAGTGLASLHTFLAQEFPHRESHSILGSTFLNPTTAAGVAFGSGGTQLRKGPAYTDRVLYLTVNETKWGQRHVKVVNTLGIEGMEDDDIDDDDGGSSSSSQRRKMDSVPSRLDIWSRWIDGGYEKRMRFSNDRGKATKAHDDSYGQRLCNNATSDASDNVTISRFNADTRGTPPNRSEGKVIILATVHDTFPKPQATKTFWVSFDSLETALAFRKQVCLDNPQDLPLSLEYMDRDSFDVIDRAGRVLSHTIGLLGTTSPVIRHLWNIKLWIEDLPFRGAHAWVDTALYWVNTVLPASLPSPIMKLGRELDHHVAMTVGEFGGGEMERLQERMEQFTKEFGKDKIQFYECGPSQAQSLTAFRFAAAPAFRTFCVGNGMQGFSVDYALPTSQGQVPPLVDSNEELEQDAPLPLKRMRYSHFGCNVVHEDLAYGANVNIHQAKMALKHAVEHVSQGKLPSEHGHGHEYVAPPETQERWKKMDPLNVLNPGIGGLSQSYRYR